MKILHVFNAMNCGGAENMIMNIYRCIDRKNFQFDFLVHSDTPAFFDEEIKKLGGNIYYVPRWNGLNTLRYIRSLYKFFKAHHDYSVIHGHMGSSAHIYLGIAKKFGIYTVAHSHNTYSEGFSIKKILFKFFTLQTRRIADDFLACTKDAGTERFGEKIVSSDRFQLIPNAIDTSKFVFSESIRRKIREKYRLEDKLVIGHIGRFNHQKNHLFLLNIFYELQKKDENCVLLLIGDGNLKAGIEEKAKALNISDKIIFTGVLSNANELLQAMDCFVFPSFYEGLGMVVIEAECFGLPCFVTDTLPADLDINENVYRLSLNASYKTWADSIINNYQTRIDSSIALENIKKSGYDVNESIKKTEDIYLKFERKRKEKNK